jgi:hypothetical protein
MLRKILGTPSFFSFVDEEKAILQCDLEMLILVLQYLGDI